MFCDILAKELKDGRRIVIENKDFVCFIPFFTTWPYGVHIYPRRYVQSLLDLNNSERRNLAQILKEMLLKYDKLFDFTLPYEMIFHQQPTDKEKYPYYHFHIEFYIIHRARNKIKFLGGCEQGAGTFICDIIPEKTAKELKEIKI